MKRNMIVAGGLAVVLGVTAYGAYELGSHQAMKSGMSAGNPTTPGKAPPGNASQQGRRVLYWHDPMVPAQKFDKPGKSPFMDMDLVPVYADDSGEQTKPGQVTIPAGVTQNLGIRTAEAHKGSLARSVQAVGDVAFDERRLTALQARNNGYVERLFVRASFDAVQKGQPLVQLYVPDWIAAQEDYLATRRMPAGVGSSGLVDAALQRMRLAGMTDSQIRKVSTSGAVNPRITVTSPSNGVVAELSVREGMTVAAGAPLFRINGLDTVWLNAEVPESAATQVRAGTPVAATTPAFPGMRFDGKVETVLPEVNASTRTLKARIRLENPGHKLVPGMFATVQLTPAATDQVLLVPSEAVIRTGDRNVVIVALGGGKFAPSEVDVGAEADGQTEIRKGLSAGQKVVASGQFLIDSESSLRGALERMDSAPSQTQPAPKQASATAPVHQAHGVIENITADQVTISHQPIPTLKWGAMTMGFVPPSSGLPPGVKVGSTVDFAIRARDDGSFAITSIAPAKSQGGRQ
jgi:Cu(I)/Ag(I) efflux system membrane fusion protein